MPSTATGAIDIMQIQNHNTQTFIAIDGTTFDVEGACRAYEARLHPHLVFCLEQKYTAEQLRHVACYQLGYTTSWTTTEYEAPGFMREGGDYTAHHSTDTMLELVHGELSDVVTYALGTQWANQRGKLIRRVKIVELPT